MWGLTVDEACGPPVGVWPDNWKTVNLFRQVLTQWRVGFSGAYALDYMPVFYLMDRMSLAHREYDEIFEGIRTMEDAALEIMRDQK